MMDLDLWGRNQLPGSAAEGLARLDTNPGLRDELRALLAYRLGRIDSVAPRLQLPFPCTLSADSPTGRRYVEHESRGHTILLFVREHRSHHGLSVPFVFLGPARYMNHAGSRPMSITWELSHPLPARLYRQPARLAVA